MTASSRRTADTAALAGLLGVAGVAHVARPGVFEPLIPRSLPGSARGWVLWSGAAELACAAAVAHPRTRAAGGTASAALFAAVLPGNITMARNYHKARRPGWQRALTLGRLPLQWPLISLARRVSRTSRDG